ncbi:MAG: helix-turn-helix domain-containing protein [Clostridia bacterium]|nr:helix-turn-helix domain-containing protein [Clostridia bacterium]
MEKNVEVCLLLDFYGKMLTERQREIMVLYYEDNLSLTEIAEELGISKQGVSDSIKRSEKVLYETENKLFLLKQYMEEKKD